MAAEKTKQSSALPSPASPESDAIPQVSGENSDVWLGDASDNWDDPTQWSLGRVPGADDETSVYVPAPSSPSPFTISIGNTVAASLSVDAPGATLAVAQDLAVTGTIAMSASALTVAPGATVSAAGLALVPSCRNCSTPS